MKQFYFLEPVFIPVVKYLWRIGTIPSTIKNQPLKIIHRPAFFPSFSPFVQ
ncbi:MAG: hypothetical protein WCS69_03480 [Ignavibacteriaceae bacterium]|jgi:hypothetical protein